MKKNAKIIRKIKKSTPSLFTDRFIKSVAVSLCLYTAIFAVLVTACVIAVKYASWRISDPLFVFLKFLYSEPAVTVGLTAILYLVGVSVILICTVKKLIKYMDSVIDASQQLLKSDGEEIVLPGQLSEVAEKMNAVKTQSLENYRLAKEQEQKKNDLLVYLAHDLKTPLTSVIGYLTLVDDAPELPEENKVKYTRIALEKAQRLEMLLNEFFDITRFSLHGIEIEKKRINLNILLYQMAEEFYPVYKEKGLEINVKADEQVVILGDPDKIARVFDNLLKNAANYSHRDTTVEITAEKVDGNAVVCIKNRADMIPKESLEKLFEMFYRADSARSASSGGAGVGLAVSKEIVELHSGTITVTSDEEYTEFTVTLPTV